MCCVKASQGGPAESVSDLYSELHAVEQRLDNLISGGGGSAPTIHSAQPEQHFEAGVVGDVESTLAEQQQQQQLGTSELAEAALAFASETAEVLQAFAVTTSGHTVEPSEIPQLSGMFSLFAAFSASDSAFLGVEEEGAPTETVTAAAAATAGTTLWTHSEDSAIDILTVLSMANAEEAEQALLTADGHDEAATLNSVPALYPSMEFQDTLHTLDTVSDMSDEDGFAVETPPVPVISPAPAAADATASSAEETDENAAEVAAVASATTASATHTPSHGSVLSDSRRQSEAISPGADDMEASRLLEGEFEYASGDGTDPVDLP